jgi:hypothetical protein
VIRDCFAQATLDVVAINIINAPFQVEAGSFVTMTASVFPLNRTLNWSVQGDDLGSTLVGNGINASLTAGGTPGMILVRVADSQLPHCYAEVAITITPQQGSVSISVIPDFIWVGGETATAFAQTTPPDQNVVWSIQGNNLGCTITPIPGVLNAANIVS